MFGFGAFRATSALSSGLLWKTPWRLSKFQKLRQRRRLRAVDGVIATLDAALAKQGETVKSIETWKAEMPTEAEMLPRDKYTMFDRKEKRYRKGIHSEFFHLFLKGLGIPSAPEAYIGPEKIHSKRRGMFDRFWTLANLKSTELPKWTRVSQRVNPPGY
ncbi:mitochondrial ribosomal protein L31-domain-containing protein [Pestalotiopsis sp. NC0098]|nr:mitochondrial ribosomal protein L31-domain-containing protein [Pestalotiopsis sp. NC0098]